MFQRLQENVAEIDAAILLQGTVEAERGDRPIFVALVTREGDDYALDAYQLRYGPGPFSFLREPGDYYLFAFADLNEDAVYQRNEDVGWYGAPTPIAARPGEDLPELTIALRPAEAAQVELPELYTTAKPVPMAVDRFRLGEVVDLDDSDFAQQVGELGLWQPVTFVRSDHTGVFFLEPYDPAKIPVLLVHGMAGFGQNWSYLARNLGERFQPWVAQYPSGLRLDLASEFLRRSIEELQLRYKVETFYVVAHSMGGLVARDFIRKFHSDADPGAIRLFVTLSTPWNGVATAQTGVDRAPAVVPSWYDMAPDSPFLRLVTQTPLPGDLPYHLLFSYRRAPSLIDSASSDGTVPLSSQLVLRMQEQAVQVIGYDESHVGILSSPAVAAELNAILTATAAQGPTS